VEPGNKRLKDYNNLKSLIKDSKDLADEAENPINQKNTLSKKTEIKEVYPY